MHTLKSSGTSMPAGETGNQTNRARKQIRAVIGTMAVVIAGITLVAAGMMIAAA